MARTSVQIQNQILAEVANQPALNKLTSTSQVSIWRLFVNVIAAAQSFLEALWDAKQVELEKIALEAVPGTTGWVARMIKAFQFGDVLTVYPNLTIAYPVVLPPTDAKRIVTQCSVKQLPATRQVLVKVATGATGALQPLSSVQLDALKAYFSKMQFAGTYVSIISLEADSLVSNVNVYFDAEYVESVVKANVIAAINTFLYNLAFDGVLLQSKFEDAIQKVEGVTDVQITSLVARPYTTPLSSPNLTAFTRAYETAAGYIISETATGYTLADTIKMLPNQ